MNTLTALMDMVLTESQGRDSPNWEVRQRTPDSELLRLETLVRGQNYMNYHVNMSLDVESKNFKRLGCDTGFTDGAPVNPSTGHGQSLPEPAIGEGALNKSFSFDRKSTNQDLIQSTYILNNKLLFSITAVE